MVSSTFYIQIKSHQWGAGILCISYQVKVTSMGWWYHPHLTSRQSYINWGVWILHISHPVKLSLSGVGGIFHISHSDKVKSIGEVGVFSTFHIQTKSHQWEAGSSTFHMQSKSHCLGGSVGGWYPPHFTSSQSHIVWGWGAKVYSTSHRVECALAVKPNWFHRYMPGIQKTPNALDA